MGNTSNALNHILLGFVCSISTILVKLIYWTWFSLCEYDSMHVLVHLVGSLFGFINPNAIWMITLYEIAVMMKANLSIISFFV